MKRGQNPQDAIPVYYDGYVLPPKQITDFTANLPLGELRPSLGWLQTLYSALSIGDNQSLSQTRQSVVNHAARQLTNDRSEALLQAIVNAAAGDREGEEAARLTVSLLINLLMNRPGDDQTLVEMNEANRISLMIETNGVQ